MPTLLARYEWGGGERCRDWLRKKSLQGGDQCISIAESQIKVSAQIKARPSLRMLQWTQLHRLACITFNKHVCNLSAVLQTQARMRQENDKPVKKIHLSVDKAAGESPSLKQLLIQLVSSLHIQQVRQSRRVFIVSRWGRQQSPVRQEPQCCAKRELNSYYSLILRVSEPWNMHWLKSILSFCCCDWKKWVLQA